MESWLRELDERNRDNVSRTESYLELYAYTRKNPPELPWVLMAHLVSRNAGYLMSDLAGRRERNPDQAPAIEQLFLFLERANYLIFYDAWFHMLTWMLGGSNAIPDGRVAKFMRSAWSRYEDRTRGSAPSPEVERALVLDLVTNEQNYIEHRVVHSPRFEMGLEMIRFVENSGREKPITLPLTSAEIKVGGFEHLDRRIRTGERIFDQVLAQEPLRSEIFTWAIAHPHTGNRSVAGGKETPEIRSGWPVDRVRALDLEIHAPSEADEKWP
jgi:hypothetical protein